MYKNADIPSIVLCRLWISHQLCVLGRRKWDMGSPKFWLCCGNFEFVLL